MRSIFFCAHKIIAPRHYLKAGGRAMWKGDDGRDHFRFSLYTSGASLPPLTVGARRFSSVGWTTRVVKMPKHKNFFSNKRAASLRQDRLCDARGWKKRKTPSALALSLSFFISHSKQRSADSNRFSTYFRRLRRQLTNSQ